MIFPEDVKRLARLSRLSYSDDQLKHITASINEVIAYVNLLDQVKIPSDLTCSSTTTVNVTREDRCLPSSTKEILDQAPDREGAFFTVPAIIKHHGETHE